MSERKRSGRESVRSVQWVSMVKSIDSFEFIGAIQMKLYMYHKSVVCVYMWNIRSFVSFIFWSLCDTPRWSHFLTNLNDLYMKTHHSRSSKVNTDIAVHNQNYHTATRNHMPYGITRCYMPPGSSNFPAFTPAEAGTRFSDHGRMQGWVDLGGGYIPR